MTFRIYDKLCEDAKKLRTEVFVAEQGFETEFDDTDSKARHIVGYDGEKPVAVCRYFYDEEHKSYMIGRIAVVKECRGLHYGDKILSFAEQMIKQDGGSRSLCPLSFVRRDFTRNRAIRSTAMSIMMNTVLMCL